MFGRPEITNAPARIILCQHNGRTFYFGEEVGVCSTANDTHVYPTGKTYDLEAREREEVDP